MCYLLFCNSLFLYLLKEGKMRWRTYQEKKSNNYLCHLSDNNFILKEIPTSFHSSN